MSDVERQQMLYLSQLESWAALKKWMLSERERAIQEVLKAALSGQGNLNRAVAVETIDKIISRVEGMAKEAQQKMS